MKLLHVQEPVAILSGQFKLGRQRKHGLVEVSQHSFHRGRVLVAVVNVVVQTDELPVKEVNENKYVSTEEGKLHQKKRIS